MTATGNEASNVILYKGLAEEHSHACRHVVIPPSVILMTTTTMTTTRTRTRTTTTTRTRTLPRATAQIL